jgi:hypothetical protein
MTTYRFDILRRVADAEMTGPIEVALRRYGYPSPLELRNVERAIKWLAANGYVDPGMFALTPLGRAAIQEAQR